MALERSTIKPGLLVSLRTLLEGNVSYTKTQLEDDHPTEDGGLQARWETERTIANAAEHEEAGKVRGKCRSVILSVCSKSNFGLLCPVSKQDQLASAVSEARRLADLFNSTSQLSKISIYVLIGELVANEVEAARAINFEVRGLISSMEDGIKKLDPQQIRDAANRAKNLGSMLSDDANEKLKEAINVARKVARAIVKEGEVAVGAIDAVTLSKLADARTAFLDLDSDDAEQSEGGVVSAQAPVVDLDDQEQPILTAESDFEDVMVESDGEFLTIAWQKKVKGMTFEDDFEVDIPQQEPAASQIELD